MKKRILSMLMLVVMVVTALPLMALTVFAETTEPEFDAEDYNALYVQEGLVYALDFFVTNEHWENKEVTFSSAADAMAAIPGYVWYNQDEKVTINIVWGTGNVKIAGGHFDTQNLKELVLWSLAGLTNKSQAPGATADMLMQVSPGAGSMPLVFNNIRPYLKAYTEDGVTKMRLEHVGVYDHSKYPPITNIKYNGQDVTLKMYSAPSSLVMTTLVPPLATSQKNTAGMDLHVGTYMRDENGEILKDENGELIISVTSTTKYYDARYIPAGPREVTTYYVDGQKQDAAQTFEKVYMAEDQNVYGDFALYEDGRLIYENKGEMPYLNNPSVSYTQTNWRLDTTIGTEPLKLDVYAARYYGRVLDANEVARNHLADLAKWFKLDLTYLHNLDKDSLIAVATDPTVTALSVSDKKEDVQKAVDAIAQAIIGEKYSDTLPEDIIAVLVGNSLDGSALLKYPKGLLPNTYSFLGGGYAKSEDV
ncbi:MAG: hypothetical protein J6V07_04205, partial [Clostridia bacterium]|nr:hypothetical protein [Clostridia bacterium]